MAPPKPNTKFIESDSVHACWNNPLNHTLHRSAVVDTENAAHALMLLEQGVELCLVLDLCSPYALYTKKTPNPMLVSREAHNRHNKPAIDLWKLWPICDIPTIATYALLGHH
jgi:hypothetical protein